MSARVCAGATTNQNANMNKILIAMAAAALAGAAFAQEPAEGPKGGERRGFDRGQRPGFGMMMAPEFGGDMAVRAVFRPKVAEKLGLSEETQAKLRDIEEDSNKKINDIQAKIRAAMEKQAELLKADSPDEDAVMKAIDELFRLRRDLAKVQTRRVLAVKKLLTPEQLKQATEELRNMRGNFGPREGGDRPRFEGNGPRREGGDRPRFEGRREGGDRGPRPNGDKPRRDRGERAPEG